MKLSNPPFPINNLISLHHYNFAVENLKIFGFGFDPPHGGVQHLIKITFF
jgi:hypothetical protein